ncbi:MAG: translation initiation factor IF-2 N-terminal domain-containing protein, partial [Proteobacteria bacterium]|nr:translation initiation factor IF-2 N-terminal domain-containing protein [Pseudomonadota bacterium]
MAKVRVYELAKELDMESKQLVDKLTAGGMDVKNYMSTLDEQEIVRAKGIVSGAVSEVVVEKRIKPTLIRRRKKVVSVEPKPPAPEIKVEEKREEKEISGIEEAPLVDEVPRAELELEGKPSVPVETPLVEREARKEKPEAADKRAVIPAKRAKAK